MIRCPSLGCRCPMRLRGCSSDAARQFARMARRPGRGRCRARTRRRLSLPPLHLRCCRLFAAVAVSPSLLCCPDQQRRPGHRGGAARLVVRLRLSPDRAVLDHRGDPVRGGALLVAGAARGAGARGRSGGLHRGPRLGRVVRRGQRIRGGLPCGGTARTAAPGPASTNRLQVERSRRERPWRERRQARASARSGLAPGHRSRNGLPGGPGSAIANRQVRCHWRRLRCWRWRAPGCWGIWRGNSSRPDFPGTRWAASGPSPAGSATS